MKIVEDEMGGIKVGCFGEKSKGNSVGQLDSWQWAIISYFKCTKHEGVRFSL
jgi:hypothetical protein